MNFFVEEESNLPRFAQPLCVLCCEVIVVVIIFFLDPELGTELLIILGVLLGVLLILFMAYTWEYTAWKVLLTLGVLFTILSPAVGEFGEVLLMLGLILILLGPLPMIFSAPLRCYQRKMLALRMKTENTPSPQLFRFLNTCFCVVFVILAVCSFLGYILLIYTVARVPKEDPFTEKAFALIIGTLSFLAIFYPIVLFFWLHREKRRPQQQRESTVEKDNFSSPDGINIIQANTGIANKNAGGLEMAQNRSSDPLSII